MGHCLSISKQTGYSDVNHPTVLETSTNISASRNQTLLGPEIAFGKSTDWGVIGAWVTHLTNVTDGDLGGDLYNTNETYIEIHEQEVDDSVLVSFVNGILPVLNPKPIIILWNAEININYLVLNYLDTDTNINFSIDRQNDDLYMISPSESLSPGTYCLIESVPFSSLSPAWCFEYLSSNLAFNDNPSCEF